VRKMPGLYRAGQPPDTDLPGSHHLHFARARVFCVGAKAKQGIRGSYALLPFSNSGE